jgi:hypothetical protein
MLKGWKARKPDYFFVVFREDPSKPPVEGGVYSHRKGFIGGSNVSVGDILLLFQNLGATGIGVVIDTEIGGEKEYIYYQYFPLCHPLAWGSLDALRNTIPELRTPLNWMGNWLQNISSTSFRAAIAGRQIDWP